MKTHISSILFCSFCLIFSLAADSFGREVPFDEAEVLASEIGGGYFISPADLNHDGRMDLLIAAYSDDDIFWIRNGSWGWERHDIDLNYNYGYCVRGGDLDGDGDNDVVAVSRGSSLLTWWENTDKYIGDSWTEHTIATGYSGASSLYLGDIDKDGDLDIATAAYTGDTVDWWENTAGDASAWTPHTIGSSFDGARYVSLADINRDGNLDLLGTAYLDDDAAWWKNSSGDGSSWLRQTFHFSFDGAVCIEAGDIDKDGDLDVAACAALANEIRWWENTTGSGSSWTSHTVASLSGVNHLVVMDMDQDGDMDIGAVAYNDDVVNWYENSGDGSGWTVRTVDVSDGPRSLAVHDFDRDGDPDVAAVSYPANDVKLWSNESTHFERVYVGPNLVHDDFNGGPVIAADLDRDGDMDLVSNGTQHEGVSWFENTDGAGGSWTEHIIMDTWAYGTSIDVADINGNGTPDVIASAENSNKISWFVNSGLAPWSERVVSSTFTEASSARAGDIDGDGDMDIVGASYADDTVSWWENTNGIGTAWTKRNISTACNGASDLAVSDIDGDGDMDVAGVATELNAVYWWENSNGAGTAWTAHAVDSYYYAPAAIKAVDMDRNARMDLVVVSDLGANLMYYENRNGLGTVWVEWVIDNSQSLDDLYIGDVDLDGGLDVLSAFRGAYDYFYLWTSRNGSSVRFDFQEIAWPFYDGFPHFPVGFYAGDIDRDGDPDLIVAGSNSRDLVWYENRPTMTGDVNKDGQVDLADVAELSANWLFGTDG